MIFDATHERLFALQCLQMRPMCDAAQLAETTRFMPSTSSMFSFDQTPYLREPTANLADVATTCGVVVKSPAQVGKTTAIENFLSWIVEYDRANTMVILDTQKSAEKMSRNRLRPFLRTRGVNNPNNTSQKNPDKSNSVVNIGLGSGANLFLCSAKSPSDLRSTPCKYLCCDEVDAWPIELKGEGDPLQNAIQRMMRFRGMYLLTSTPTFFEGRIYQNYLLGTQQTWGVKCNCGAFLDVRYDDIDFTTDPPTYHCKTCGAVFTERLIKSMHHCYSEPKNKAPLVDQYGRTLRSFEIFGTLCHQFYSWDYLKQLEIANLSLGEASFQSFRNTRLGEIYTPKDDISIDVLGLARVCADDYDHSSIPDDVEFIVMGIDTHDTCLYAETAGFSVDLKKIYGLRYDVLVGDPNEKDVWIALFELMKSEYKRKNGTMIQPRFAFCDSGGHRTNAVYMQSFRNRRFLPVKGYVSHQKNAPDPLIGRQQKLKMNAGIKGKCTVQFVGVNAGKDQLHQLEILTLAGDKRLFYPHPKHNCGYDEEYFRGLLSEKKIGDKWIAPQKGHTNNEPLDCRVYAMACAEYYLKRYYLTGKDLEAGDMAKKKNQEVKENIENSECKADDVCTKHKDNLQPQSAQPVQPKPTSGNDEEYAMKISKFPHL